MIETIVCRECSKYVECDFSNDRGQAMYEIELCWECMTSDDQVNDDERLGPYVGPFLFPCFQCGDDVYMRCTWGSISYAICAPCMKEYLF